MKNSNNGKCKRILFVVWLAVLFVCLVACQKTKDLTDEFGKVASSLIRSETITDDEDKSSVSEEDMIPDSEKSKTETEGNSEKQDKPETEGNSERQDKPETDGGGNKYYNESERQIIEIEVLVSEAEYICNNKPITLEELLKKIKESKADVIVKISDHNATYKAYNSLIDLLVENGISYLETD